MNNDVSGAAEMEIDKSGGSGPSLNEVGVFRVKHYCRPFSRSSVPDFQEAWPEVKSALKEIGLHCNLDLRRYVITFSTTRKAEPDAIVKARCLLRFLSAGAPARQAIKILTGMDFALIYTGFHTDGICSRFSISPDQYVSRKKLLMSLPLEELGELTKCDIYLCAHEDLVAAMGPFQGLKLITRVVEECIARKVPPVPRVRGLKRLLGTMKGIQALSLR